MRTFSFEPQKVYPIGGRYNNLEEIAKRTKDPKAWKDPEKEEFVCSNLTDGGDAYHTNFLDYLEKCYNTHQSIVLQPHVFWNTILNEISSYTNENVEECRHLFTDSDDKKEILIYEMSIVPPLDIFEAELRKLVPTSMDPFLPGFSTETTQSKLANIATFMEAVSPYYSYMMFACGYNAVRIEGTQEDWMRIADTAFHLTEVLPGLAPYLRRVAGAILNFIDWMNKGNGEQIAKILTNTRVGSGGDTAIEGWITKFFREKNLPNRLMKLCNFPSHIAKVPYEIVNGPNKGHYHLCYGLFSSKLDGDGFLVPDFGYIINKRLA